MQAIVKLIQAFLWAWQYAKENPRKSIAAGVGVGATSAAMLMSGVQYPPPLITAANTTNAPGSNGQVLESNGDNTYTFGEPGGVGGGATELAELDDVSDTLVGAQGDFIGWDGADWDDIEVTIDTATDVTITAAATGEVIRYNGSAWVDSALSVDDLSEVTITSLAAGEILRYNGSALVDTTLSIDDLTEVTITTPADDQFLRYNGSGWVNETVSVSVDATGITDGYVYTADGDATPAWEAPAVGGLLTPDSATAVTNTRRFNPYDYKASGSRRIEYVKWSGTGPTTWSTRTSADAARDHDYTVGMGVALHGAGDACGIAAAPPVTGVNATVTRVGAAITFTADSGTNLITTSRAAPITNGDPVRFTTTTTLPGGLALATTRYLAKVTSTTFRVYDTSGDAVTNDGTTGRTIITDAGTGTHTVDGYTQWDVQFVATDGNGGATAASTAVSTRGWKIPAGWTADYYTHVVPVPYGAASVAIYGAYDGGTNQLLTILDTVKGLNSAGTAGATSVDSRFTGISNSGGFAQLTGVEDTTGLAVNDYINIKCSTSGDTVYDVRALVTAFVANTSITTDVSYDGTATTAAGSWRRGSAAWHFKGFLPPLHATKYVPDVENPVYDWRASTAVRQGQLCIDSSGSRLWRCIRSIGGRLTGSSEPTWAAAADTVLVDNEVTWALEANFLPVDAPSSAQRQTLLTTIATVPTSSTFTTTADAQGGDVASVRLVCCHNDAKAFRDCQTAMKTYNRPAVLEISAGDYQIHLPKQTNTSYFTAQEAVNTISHSFLYLNSGVDDVAFPRFSVVADPGAIIRCRNMQTRVMVEDLVVGGSIRTGSTTFLTQCTDNAEISGGEWEWAPAAGGFTEHDCAWSYGPGNAWLGGKRFLVEEAATSVGLTVRDCIVHWPSIATSISSISAANEMKLGYQSWYNCQLFYGGGDGDFTFSPHGEFLMHGCWVRNVTRYGSHGLYPGADTEGVKVSDCTFQEVGKFSIQARAEGGNAYTKGIQVSNSRFINSGAILLGDVTSSNRDYSITLTGLTGAALSLAECRDLSVVGGQYTTIQVREDCKDIQISSLTCDTLELIPGNSSTDGSQSVKVSGVTVKTLLSVGSLSDSVIEGVTILNGVRRGTVLNSGTYEWTAVGGLTNVFQCELRGSDRDPGFTTPTAGGQLGGTVMWFDDAQSMATATTGVATLNAVASGTWYFGNTEVQTIAISGSPTGGTWTASFNGAGPTGAIAAGASASTVQTALRTLTGLSACTVTQSGSGNNLTYTVAMTGFSGDPPEMTSASSLTGGTPVITHATPNAYPGFNTYALQHTDSARVNPNEAPYGTISVAEMANYQQNLYLDYSLSNVTFRNLSIRSTWPAAFAFVQTQSSGVASLRTKNVVFDNATFEDTAVSSGATFYLVDLGTVAMLDLDILFKGGKFNSSISGSHRPYRANFINGGNLTFDGTDFTAHNGAPTQTNGKGNVHLKRCKILTNRIHVTTNATTNAWNINTALSTTNANSDLTSHPVILQLGNGSAVPTTSPQVTANTLYWINTADKTLHTTFADAEAGTNDIDITTDAVSAVLVFLDYARRTLSSYSGPGAASDDSFGYMEDNEWRGAKSILHVDISADQDNYAFPRHVNNHILVPTSSARNFTGFDAPAAGTVEWEFTIENQGAVNLTFADSSGSSSAENQLLTPGGGGITQTPGQKSIWRYDVLVQKWRGNLLD